MNFYDPKRAQEFQERMFDPESAQRFRNVIGSPESLRKFKEGVCKPLDRYRKVQDTLKGFEEMMETIQPFTKPRPKIVNPYDQPPYLPTEDVLKLEY